MENDVENIIDKATTARKIICYNKQVKPISKIERRRVKMNIANDLRG